MAKQFLRCASLALASLLTFNPCLAFTTPTNTLHRQSPPSSIDFSLCVTSNADDETHHSLNSRRSFLGKIVATAATSTQLGSPLAALAADQDSSPQQQSSKLKPLSTYIYNILRVREATEQETRLISTGKFKDVQRANVKLAVKFMVNNYKLSDSIIAASSYLAGNARVQASGVGQSAVQSLYTILEYFDSSDVENIKVRILVFSTATYFYICLLIFSFSTKRLRQQVGSDSMSGKESIVTKGLESVRRDIDDFLSYFPRDVVEEAKAKILEENELNFKEFDPSLGSILNPNPK